MTKIIESDTTSTEEVDYSLAFYIYDGSIVCMCICALFLKISMEKTGEKSTKQLKKIFSKPAWNLFAFCFLMGFAWGIHDSFLYVYLQEELGASSAEISKHQWKVNLSNLDQHLLFQGYYIIIGSTSCLIANIFAKQIVVWLGQVNLIFFGLVMEGARFLVYSLIT